MDRNAGDAVNGNDGSGPSSGKIDQRKLVRRAERDQWNRFMSVQLDAEWVTLFCRQHRLERFPLVANLRCGSWYVSPASQNVSRYGCYFKSTDGHTNEWSFSLKRFNQNVLSLVQQHDGCVIVDSTRRGKSMPDALSKTIPIWCAVLNAANEELHAPSWSTEHAALHVPQQVVSPSEKAQMQSRIGGWVDDLLDSDLQVPQLRKPLRPIFVARSHVDQQVQLLKETATETGYHPVILISASPMVPTPHLDPVQHDFQGTATRREQGEGGSSLLDLQRQQKFVYVQGSGDDEEMWSGGLTPTMFWSEDNLRAILSTGGDTEALRLCIDTVVMQHKLASTTLSGNDAERIGSQDVQIGTTFPIWFGLRPFAYTPHREELSKYDLIIHCDGQVSEGAEGDATAEATREDGKVLHLGIEHGKRGLPAFRHSIPGVIAAAQKAIQNAGERCAILLCSAEGNAIGHDLNGAMAIVILATCFDADKALLPLDGQTAVHIPPTLTKDDVQKRLQWITTLVPHAKPPSRKHILRINEALLSQPVLAQMDR